MRNSILRCFLMLTGTDGRERSVTMNGKRFVVVRGTWNCSARIADELTQRELVWRGAWVSPS